MGTVDQTMPALFARKAGESGILPLAQLGSGPDGIAMLANKGDRLVEVFDLSFGPQSPRWPVLEARLRAISSVDHPAIRGVLALERDPPSVVLEGDRAPPLAELVEQAACDLTRAMNLIGELARAIAAAHHVGVVHGRLHPWAVHVGNGDRVRIELTGLVTRAIEHPWAVRCTAPELREGAPHDAAVDVYAIGGLLEVFATNAGRELTDGTRAIIAEACASDPDARPSAAELVCRILGASTVVRSTLREIDVPLRASRPQLGMTLGRFELVRQLGVGAMGEVWAARDHTGGPDVAIKLLKPEIAADDELVRRFRKEARVLARVGSPFIANIVDLNEDHGQHYLALELVPGGSVAAALRRLGKLPETLALGIVADTCRALVEPHRLGIVHRDLKPDNMMFVREGIELETSPTGQLVKLGDFGIARLVEHHAPEGATREGSVLGTPEFMAPEQCEGKTVTPATDVYALGCCLYSLIAGRPPFVVHDDQAMTVILQHVRDEPPRLDTLAPEASREISDLAARCLAKDPRTRPQDATEVLAAIDALCSGSTALVSAHPSPPIVRVGAVQTYSFAWELASSPEQLWPFVSNTEKMNRAAGLPPARFEVEAMGAQRASESSVTTGSQRVAGIALEWREHPYEWIEGSRHVVLRVFTRGVLRWYISEVELERLAGGGTRLRNTVKMEPRGLLARVMSKFEIGFRYRRRLEKVYRRLDRLLVAGPKPEIDPIDPDVRVSSAGRDQLSHASEQLRSAGVASDAVDALISYLLHASDQDVARMRPLELAKKFSVEDDAMIEAFLHAAKLGVVTMVWDVICPSCRIPSSIVESLRRIEEHGSCRACNVAFDVDFSRGIELAFRAAPEIRPVETRTYCIGGPAHFPHVAAQVRLTPGERLALPLALPAGFYRLRSPQLPRGHDLRITSAGGMRRLDVTLGERSELPAMTAGDQLIVLVNPTARELLVRVERAGDRAFALSGARAIATAAFRELFPDQALAPGRLIAITQATLVVAQLADAAKLFDELGDAKAFPIAARFFEEVTRLAREHGGTLVKTFGGLALAAFEGAGPAVDVGLAIQAALDAHPTTSGMLACVAVHRGPMMALTQAGRLDYFGQHVERALAIDCPPGAVALTNAVCQDPAVAERLVATIEQLGIEPMPQGTWALRLRAPRGARAAST